MRQGCGEVSIGKRRNIRHRKQVKAVSPIEIRQNRYGFGRNRHDRSQVAALETIERGRLVNVYDLHINAEPFEHGAAGVVGAASFHIEAYPASTRDPLISNDLQYARARCFQTEA